MNRYHSLDTTSNVQNCLTTYQNDPVGMLNCIRTSMGYTSVTTGTVPAIDNTTIACMKAVFDQFHGSIDVTNGTEMMPFQTVLTMINEIRACLGLPAINIPPTVSCIMTNCMTTAQPASDITTCVKNCASLNQY